MNGMQLRIFCNLFRKTSESLEGFLSLNHLSNEISFTISFDRFRFQGSDCEILLVRYYFQDMKTICVC